MGLLDWFRPRWRHSSPEVRREAILALPEFHHAIAEIARTDKDPGLRRLALERSEDTDLMRERIASEDEPEVRAFAEARLAQLTRGTGAGMSQVIGARPSAKPAVVAKPAPVAKPVAPKAAQVAKAPAKPKRVAVEKTAPAQKVKKNDKFGHVRKPARPAPAAPAFEAEVLSKDEAERRYGAMFAPPAAPPKPAPAPAPTPAPAPPPEDLLDTDLPEGPPPAVTFDDLDEPSDLHTAPLPPPAKAAPARDRDREREREREDERRKRNQERRREEEEYRAWAVLPQFEALISRAEALGKDEAIDARRLARDLKELREAWRALGAPPTEHAERLRAAIREKVEPLQARAKAGFEAMDQERAQNLEKKKVLLDTLEAVIEGPDARASVELLRHTLDAWRTVGSVPREHADALGARLAAAREKINNRRDEARAASNAAAAARLDELRRLVSQAESLSTARDPSGAAERMKGLQQSWKAVGPTGPREEVDALWHRLRAAADAVFERRNAAEATMRAANEEKKQGLINRALRLAEEGEVADPDAVIRGMQNEWRKIGPVSRDANEILWQGFREACNRLRSPPPVDAAALGDGKGHLSFNPFATLHKG